MSNFSFLVPFPTDEEHLNFVKVLEKLSCPLCGHFLRGGIFQETANLNCSSSPEEYFVRRVSYLSDPVEERIKHKFEKCAYEIFAKSYPDECNTSVTKYDYTPVMGNVATPIAPHTGAIGPVTVTSGNGGSITITGGSGGFSGVGGTVTINGGNGGNSYLLYVKDVKLQFFFQKLTQEQLEDKLSLYQTFS